MGHLSCPLCERGYIDDVKDLQQKIASLLCRSLQCPICSTNLNGLASLHSHLATHLPLDNFQTQTPNQQAYDSLKDSDTTSQRNDSSHAVDTETNSYMYTDDLRSYLNKSEPFPAIETLDIHDDKISAELSPPQGNGCQSKFDKPRSPNSANFFNSSRPSSQCSNDQKQSKEWFPTSPPEQHSCDICGLIFSKDHFLQLHKDIMHKNSCYFEVSCKICKTKFEDLESYRNHVREAHSERRYMCEECPKTFKLKGSLAVHKRMYHDGNPSICQICKKKFPSNARREFHERRYHSSTKSIFNGKPPFSEMNSKLHSENSQHLANKHDSSKDSTVDSLEEVLKKSPHRRQESSFEILPPPHKSGKHAVVPQNFENGAMNEAPSFIYNAENFRQNLWLEDSVESTMQSSSDQPETQSENSSKVSIVNCFDTLPNLVEPFPKEPKQSYPPLLFSFWGNAGGDNISNPPNLKEISTNEQQIPSQVFHSSSNCNDLLSQLIMQTPDAQISSIPENIENKRNLESVSIPNSFNLHTYHINYNNNNIGIDYMNNSKISTILPSASETHVTTDNLEPGHNDIIVPRSGVEFTESVQKFPPSTETENLNGQSSNNELPLSTSRISKKSEVWLKVD